MNKRILNLEPFSVFANMPFKEPDWLLADSLALGSCTLLSGKPKAGKSTFVRHLIKAIISGSEFLGKKTNKSSVIYLALEEQRDFVRKIFTDIGMGSNDLLHLHVGAIDKSDPGQLLFQLKEAVEIYRCKLIVVDPFIKAVSFFDTNDYGKATLATEMFLEFAHRNNVHVLLLHHARKGEVTGHDSAIGSIGFAGGVDNTVIFESNGQYSTLSFRGRYIEEHDISFVRSGNSLKIVDDTTKEALVAEKILENLRKKAHLSREDLKARIQCRDELLGRAIVSLQDSGQIQCEGKGVKGSKRLYKLNSLLETDLGEESVEL